MKLYFHRRYSGTSGKCAEDFGHGVSEALLNGFAVPDIDQCPKARERFAGATYRELQRWAKALGVEAGGDHDALHTRVGGAIIEAVKGQGQSVSDETDKKATPKTRKGDYLTTRSQPLDKGSDAARERLERLASKEDEDGATDR